MKIEDIIRDIRDIIYDTNRNWNNVNQSKTDATRDYDDFELAMSGLDDACDGLSLIEEMLKTLVYNIEMETLSAKVQGRATEKVQSK